MFCTSPAARAMRAMRTFVFPFIFYPSAGSGVGGIFQVLGHISDFGWHIPGFGRHISDFGFHSTLSAYAFNSLADLCRSEVYLPQSPYLLRRHPLNTRAYSLIRCRRKWQTARSSSRKIIGFQERIDNCGSYVPPNWVLKSGFYLIPFIYHVFNTIHTLSVFISIKGMVVNHIEPCPYPLCKFII